MAFSVGGMALLCPLETFYCSSKLLKIFRNGNFRSLRSSRATVKCRNTPSSLLQSYKAERDPAVFSASQTKVQKALVVDAELHHDKLVSCDQNFPVEKERIHQDQEPHRQFYNSVTAEDTNHLLAAKVTPLYKVSYEEQLKIKYSKCRRILKNIGLVLKKNANISIGSDCLPCALESIVPSPVTKNYRNKDEFSIWNGSDGNTKTVGLFLDSIVENPNTLCVNTDEINIIKESHKAVAKDFENYIRQSPLDCSMCFSDSRHWQNIIVRSNMQGEVMAIVKIHPQQLTFEQKEMEKKKLKEYFLSLKSKKYNLKSLYFLECCHTKSADGESPLQLLYGDEYLFEQLNNIKFRISPGSFFPTNAPAGEHLLKVIFNLCQANKGSVVVDMFCGTGPVSLTFAPHVRKCIGIDIAPQVVEDARANSKINNVTNVEFFAGKSQNLLASALDKEYGEEFIAIVNPSSSCLGKSAIHCLRYCKYLTKVLYVSCKPSAAIQNFTELCRPAGKDFHLGKPFYPMIAVPVDTFPHTNHCQLAILFQRL